MRKSAATMALGFLLAAAALTSGDARAEEEFDLKVTGNKILVVTKGSWHINLAYPWKLTVGETKLDKTKFAMTNTHASLADAPKGTGTLKGGVCSGNECKTFEKQVTLR
jgi:hypothetical protein